MIESEEVIDVGKRLVCPWRCTARRLLRPCLHVGALAVFLWVAAGPQSEPELRSSVDRWLEVLESAAVAPEYVRPLVLTTGCEEHLECNLRCAGLASEFSADLRSCLVDVSRSFVSELPRYHFDSYVALIDEALFFDPRALGP